LKSRARSFGKLLGLRALVVCASLFFWFATAAPAAPVLVGHPGFAGQTLDADGAKAVLLGKRITLGGARVVIVFARNGDAQDAVLQALLGMTTSQFQTHWRRLFMTGGGSAPRIVETEAEALKLAADTPGAITFADSARASPLVILAP